jgi:hypothetical protein
VHRSGTSQGGRTRAGIVSAVVAASLGGGVLAAAATASTSERPTASAAAATGTVLGGRTSQGWPIVVELSKTGRQIVRMSAGLHLTCTSGGVVNLPDTYGKLTVSSSGKFSASFGPETQRNQDGTTTDFEGSITGKLNKARTKVSGKWQFKGTGHDATGAVTDTCDSGTVRWSAKA